jgi:uncharacterized protein
MAEFPKSCERRLEIGGGAMRRKDRAITRFEDIVAVMSNCEVCHVGFHDDEYPYVVPMNFGMTVDDEHRITLYFHGAEAGKKHDLLKKDNRVGFVMEDTHGIKTGKHVGACECTMEFESVMGTGTIEYVDDAAKVEALHAILKQYNVSEGPNYHFHDEVVPRTVLLMLKVKEVTAKRRKVGLP